MEELSACTIIVYQTETLIALIMVRLLQKNVVKGVNMEKEKTKMTLEEKIREIFEEYTGDSGYIYLVGGVEQKVLAVVNETGRELDELIKNRPSHDWMIDNLDKIEVVEACFLGIEKKVAELTSSVPDEVNGEAKP